MVRVRFAPSPTGFLHIGSLRTALYNYLFARHHGGVCVLRIEDTDRTRFVEGAIEEQISSLAWAGITFDEGPHVGGAFGPYTQSERFDLYSKHAMLLIQSGHAYYAFDTAEELDAMRLRQQSAGIAPRYDRTSMRNQYTLGEQETERLLADNTSRVVRLKVPHTSDVRFHDLVRGEVVVHGREIDDQILLKSDGFPTYHLANVVDDHSMQISHVIRAEEWLPSTPKHALLYDAFGWKPPEFAHVPLLLNPDRSKMSKRFGDVMVRDYRDKGFFPEALLNFVALCGWNPADDNEIYSLQSMIELFSLPRVHKAGAIFDYKKLEWMNGEYLRAMDPSQLAAIIAPALLDAGYAYTDPEYVARVVALLRERVTFVQELVAFADYMFSDDIAPIEAAAIATLKSDAAFMQGVAAFRDGLSNASLADFEAFSALSKASATAAGLKMGQLLKPLRLIVTGRDVGADLFPTFQLLGLQRCQTRLEAFLS